MGTIVTSQGSVRLDHHGWVSVGALGRDGLAEYGSIHIGMSSVISGWNHGSVMRLKKSADMPCTWSNFEGCFRYGPRFNCPCGCGRCDFKAAHTAASPAARSPIARAQARHSASPRAQIHSRHRARPCPAASTASPSPSLTAPLSPLAALQLIPSRFPFRRRENFLCRVWGGLPERLPFTSSLNPPDLFGRATLTISGHDYAPRHAAAHALTRPPLVARSRRSIPYLTLPPHPSFRPRLS